MTVAIYELDTEREGLAALDRPAFERWGVMHYSGGERMATVYSRLRSQDWRDLQTGHRWRLVITRWRDGEDEHGFYRVSCGEWVSPMSYRTRFAATHIAAGPDLEQDSDLTYAVEQVEEGDGRHRFRRVQLDRLARRVARAARRAWLSDPKAIDA